MGGWKGWLGEKWKGTGKGEEKRELQGILCWEALFSQEKQREMKRGKREKKGKDEVKLGKFGQERKEGG